MKKSVSLILAGTLMLGAAACSGPSNREMLIARADFWQRAGVTDAALMDGPKTQQMLFRDLARCETEMNELEYLGTARDTIPPSAANSRYHTASAKERELGKWEMPGRNSYQLAERGKYMNFEGCMVDNGWERVEHVPYDIATKERGKYVDGLIDQRFRSKMGYRDQDNYYYNDGPRHGNDAKATGTNQ